MTGNAIPSNCVNHFERRARRVNYTSEKNLSPELFFIVQTFIMSESDLLEVLENEEIIAKVTKFHSVCASESVFVVF